MKNLKHEDVHQDNDLHKGAHEEDNSRAKGQNSFKGQLSHRESDPMIKASDSDFPEPGGSPEHSGEPEQADDNTSVAGSRGRTRRRG